jgi:hypothetical protein
MSTPDPRLTRYLLGELAEPDETALEREIFEKPEVFAQLTQVETALVDDYVRRRLPPQIRARFERHYLSDPRRRARVEFADALMAKIDEVESSAEAPASGPRPGWRDAFRAFTAGPAWRASVAAALVVSIASTGWLWLESRRLRAELARNEIASARDRQSAHDLQGQLSSAQTTARDLASELERLKTPPPQPPAQTFVSLLLTVPSARAPSTGPAPTLTIPTGIREVHLELALDEAPYASYQVALSRVAGPVVFTQRRVEARKVAAGARIAVTVPADRLAAGDYMLTLSGERAGLEAEAVSQLLFRVTQSASR